MTLKALELELEPTIACLGHQKQLKSMMKSEFTAKGVLGPWTPCLSAKMPLKPSLSQETNLGMYLNEFWTS